jgi:hypothetical protein
VVTWHYASLFASLSLPLHFLCHTADGKSPIRARFTNEQHRLATTSTDTKALSVPFLIIPQISDTVARKNLILPKTTSTRPPAQITAQHHGAGPIAKTAGNTQPNARIAAKDAILPARSGL